MSNSVAFVVAPYGFGPSAKAIAISSYLPRSVERVFLGEGPPLEMARLSNEFSSCTCLDFRTASDAAASLLADFDVLIFVNSTRFIVAPIVAGRPTILVETLAWLRDVPPSCAPLLSAFFAQCFFDRQFSPTLEEMTNFHAVGPIVPKSIAAAAMASAARTTQSPIVHCGGLFSPAMVDRAGETFVAHTLGAIGSFRGAVRAILPSHLHDAIRPILDDRISLLRCSSLSVHEHIVGSEFALTTTGIEFTYESMLLGVPTLFLPPFNASQSFQLDYHATFDRYSVPFNVSPSASFEFNAIHEATAALQRLGMNGLWQDQFAGVARFLGGLTTGERGEFLATVRDNQQRAIRAMGTDGAKMIASRILHEVGLEVGAT